MMSSASCKGTVEQRMFQRPCDEVDYTLDCAPHSGLMSADPLVTRRVPRMPQFVQKQVESRYNQSNDFKDLISNYSPLSEFILSIC